MNISEGVDFLYFRFHTYHLPDSITTTSKVIVDALKASTITPENSLKRIEILSFYLIEV